LTESPDDFQGSHPFRSKRIPVPIRSGIAVTRPRLPVLLSECLAQLGHTATLGQTQLARFSLDGVEALSPKYLIGF
jgi:hypothetical protein